MAISIGGDWDIDKKISKATLSKRKSLVKKIIEEHFEMTLVDTTPVGKNLNYLWWMYRKGTKQDQFKPFILIFEINLLVSLNILKEDEGKNIESMLESQDEDNYYMALLVIDKQREERIKVHGKWNKTDVSKEFVDLVMNYSDKVVKNYPINKR